MAFRKLVGSYKDYELSTHIIEEGYLAVDVSDGTLRIGDGTTPGGSVVSSGGGASTGDITFVGSTIISPSNAAISLNPAGTGTIELQANTNVTGTLTSSTSLALATGATVTGILDEDAMGSDSATQLATQQSIKAYVDSQDHSGGSTGDISFVGATIAAPSNAPLTLTSSGSSVDIEGLSIAGTVLSTTDSSAGIEITGNLIPSSDGVYQLGSASRRWQTAYLSAETLDIGGATISSDSTGSISISATGAVFPAGSKVSNQNIMLGGIAGATAGRPVQIVGVYASDGSTIYTDAQLLAKTADKDLEFNGTVDDVPVYTEAGQVFTLATGATLVSTITGVTLFQF